MNFKSLSRSLESNLEFLAHRLAQSNRSLEADDLYQEMMLHLWDKFRDGVPEGINRSYIVRGCKFHILNYLRKKRDKAWMVSLEEPINENGNTLKDILAARQQDTRKDIDAELTADQILHNGLTRREKEVFLFLLQGYTLRETGRKLGISHVRVVNLRRNIRQKWEKKLA